MKLREVGRYLLAVVVLTVAYTIAGKTCLRYAIVHPSASPIWLPSGLALAALLALGYRAWPGLFLGAFIVNVTTAGSIATSIGIATGNTLEALAAAYFTNAFANGKRAFDRAEDVAKFVFLAGFLSTLVSPTIGVTSLALAGYAPLAHYAGIWLTWWLGDAGGNIVAAPLFILLWDRSRKERWTRLNVLEGVFFACLIAWLALIVFDGFVFSSADRFPLEFICIPPIIWVAYRLGQRATAAAVFLLTAIALWGTLHHYGPFARHDPNVSVLLMDTFVGVITIMGLILAAVVEEREKGDEMLRQALDSLELRVQERTISLASTVADLKAEVSHRKQMELSLRESQERLALLFEHVKDYAIIMLDPDGKIVSWNAGAERIKGYTASEIVGRHYSVFFLPEGIARGEPNAVLQRARETGRVELIGLRVKKDGTTFWADTIVTPLFDKQGQLRGYAKITRDITERRLAEETLRESEERFRQLVDSNIIGFMLIDRQGRVMEANDAVLRILGYTRDEFNASGLNETTITPPQFQMLDQWMQDRLEAGGVCPAIEKEFIRKDSCRIPVLVGVVKLAGVEGHRLCFVIDVTERRSAQDALRKAYDELEVRVQQRTAELQEEVLRRQHAEEELQNQAIHDPLTGLYNRRGFMTFAENQLQLARRQQVPLLLFMGDLDDLKKINDQFGHAEGDYALARLSEILCKTFRQSDVIARIGGDEFAMVGLEEPDHTEGSLIARLQQQIDDYNRYSGRPYRIRLSIGVSRIAPESTGALEQMMQQADARLYEQKKHKDTNLINQVARDV